MVDVLVYTIFWHGLYTYIGSGYIYSINVTFFYPTDSISIQKMGFFIQLNNKWSFWQCQDRRVDSSMKLKFRVNVRL